jgi:taurine dioxygenase
MRIETRFLNGKVGAEVLNVDISRPLADSVVEDLRQLWLDRGLVLFRNQSLTAEQQIAFSRYFGDLEVHPIAAIRSPDHEQLMELDSRNRRSTVEGRYGGKPIVGRLGWHKDLIYTAKPNRGAVLRPVVLPPEDGQTGFADQGLAYDALPEATKRRIEGLKVIYRFDVRIENFRFMDTSDYLGPPDRPLTVKEAGLGEFPDSLYPLVYEHPVDKRKILNVCAMFMHGIQGMDNEEGDQLLRELLAHVTSDEFTYWHEWKLSDVLMWDNWRMIHATSGHSPDYVRKIQRSTILGDAVLGTVLQ